MILGWCLKWKLSDSCELHNSDGFFYVLQAHASFHIWLFLGLFPFFHLNYLCVYFKRYLSFMHLLSYV